MLAELERVADYLVLIARGRVRLQGQVPELLASHRLLTGPSTGAPVPADWEVIQSSPAGAQTHQLVRLPPSEQPLPPAYQARPVGVEELAMGYLRGKPPHHHGRHRSERPDDRAHSCTGHFCRPVPWSSLVWVVWRRYRFTLAGTAGILTLLAADLVITGVRARSAHAAVLACTPNNSAQCRFGFINFHDTYAQVGLVGVTLVLLPGFIGAFAGAPILARELETGTFRYTWTQGVGRMRWAIAVLVSGAVGVAVIIGVFGILVSWQQQPLVDSGIVQRMHSTNFSVTGIACAGWGLLGFGLGVLAGLLWRRVLPALVTAFAAWFGLAFLTADVLRPGYLSALTTTSLSLADNDLPVNQWWTRRRQSHRRPDQFGPAGRRRADGYRRRQHPGRTQQRRQRRQRRSGPVPPPARLPPSHQLPTRQPLLDVPVDRIRLAHHPHPPDPRRHAMAATETIGSATSSPRELRPRGAE